MKMKEFLIKFSMYFKRAGKIIIILIAMFVGFFTGEIYHRYKDKIMSEKMPIPKTHKEVSIAINECGEIMFIDRSTGKYQLYTDSVGQIFFDLYSTKMMYSAKK